MRFLVDTIQHFNHFAQAFVVLPHRRLVQNKHFGIGSDYRRDRNSAFLTFRKRLRMTGIQLFYTKFFGYFVGIFVRLRAEFDLIFDRRHEELVVGILIHDADLFVPCLAGSALLTEALVYILPYNAACWLFEP